MPLSPFFQKYSITPETRLVVACSGGPDSMYLLVRTLEIHPKDRLVVAHFNHHLREGESDADEAFVKDFCLANGLECQIEHADVGAFAKSKKKGTEEAARILRYEFFERIREGSKASWILTAHHADDRIETAIFNLIRGTKLGGLVSLHEQNGDILRPLLSVSKSEILDFLDSHNVSYRQDTSNLDTTFLRNRIRHEILPHFSEINPSYQKAIAGFLDHSEAVQQFLDEQIRVFLGNTNSFSIESFDRLPPFLQKETIRYCYEQANSGTIGLSESNIAEILRFMHDRGNYTEKTLRNLRLHKKNGVVSWK